MKYEFITNINNFNIKDFKSDLKIVENSEILVWELHKSGRIIDLFDAIKERNYKVSELIILYRSSSKKFEEIQAEIVSKYPDVESVNFKSHFGKISILLVDLEKLLDKQVRELNISDNLLYTSKRTEILNGIKKQDYESEFTTIIKEILSLIVDDNSNINNTNTEINKKSEIREDLENIQTVIKKEEKIEIKIEEPKIAKEKDIILEKAIEEVNSQKIEIEDTSDIKITETISDNIIKEEIIKDNKIEIEKSKGNITQIDSEIPEEINEKTEEEIKFVGGDNNEEIIIKEPSKEELMDIIETYFCYNDSPEIDKDKKDSILKHAIESKSAIKYAETLLNLKKEGKLDEVTSVVQKIYGNTLSDLYNYDIGISAYSSSQSWAFWDVAKQIYYFNHPSMTDQTKYKIANPLDDEDKQNEILDRRVGWEIYSKLTTGELDNFLNKFKEPIYRKRMVNFMIEKPNKFDTLASYKLAELGKNVRLGFLKI